MDPEQIPEAGKLPEGVVPQLPSPRLKTLRKITRKKYCAVITIREGLGDKIKRTDVPASALDNRLANVIVAAKLRGLIESQINKYAEADTLITPKELLETSQALDRCAEVSYRAHGDVLSKEKVPELAPITQKTSNHNHIKNLVIGGGQTVESLGNIFDAVEQAARTPMKNVTPNDARPNPENP
jgi:hypothetical protein